MAQRTEVAQRTKTIRPAGEEVASGGLGDCPGERPLSLPHIDSESICEAARLHKALSDETRLRILACLQIGELCVCELYRELDAPQSTVSHHLFLLQNAGLITSRKDGRWVLYSINHDVFDRCNPFCDGGVDSRE